MKMANNLVDLVVRGKESFRVYNVSCGCGLNHRLSFWDYFLVSHKDVAGTRFSYFESTITCSCGEWLGGFYVPVENVSLADDLFSGVLMMEKEL